ncbi:MAG TPA: type I-MYXAN CRISPR-associated Cas8a1/Cmx1 [Pyrinomonadaceae bacterium]
MKMTIKLNAPGMTSLHKAGLAGLYMTLQVFDETNVKIKGLDWQLEPTSVVLSWQDEISATAFDNLIQKSFWRDDEGFIRLTGLEGHKPPTTEQKYHLYIALMNSFLQFGPHRPTGNKRPLSYEIDDRTYWIKEFAPIKEFRHQEAAKDFIDTKGRFKKSVEAGGWLYPGGGQRHVAHSETKLSEPIESALALIFAPVGVIYYTLKSRAKGRKARLAMLVPEIQDLEMYAEIRQAFVAQGVLDLTASSASDAALKMITFIEANRTSNQFAEFTGGSFVCRMITFGIVSWNEKQKSRTYVRSVVSGQLSGLENYRKAAAIFKNRWQLIQAKRDRKGNQIEPERYFVTTFSAREFIADNIALGNTWYHDLATYMSNKESREQLLYERKELNEMVENASYDDESERVFISVCHESWRRRMGKLGERARRESLGDSGFKRLVRKEAEKLRTALAHSKNADTLRETVVDFWARAGANEALQGDGLINLLPFFNEKNWRKTRDLALLALISYKPQTPEEAEILTTIAAIDEEGESNE